MSERRETTMPAEKPTRLHRRDRKRERQRGEREREQEETKRRKCKFEVTEGKMTRHKYNLE